MSRYSSSGVPAASVGRQQEIEIGHMSGLSNVKYWLRKRGHDSADEELCDRILRAAKATDHTLTDREIGALIADV